MKHSSNVQALQIVAGLPKNMLKMHGADNVSEFVLHELSCKDCFNLAKAAYFVDNPAFNCLKGVAGFSQEEACRLSVPIWDDPDRFSQHMQGSSFNNRVRNFAQYSCKNCDKPDEEILHGLATQLGMDTFNYCTWQMKHDNHGFLLYQTCGEQPNKDDLINGLSLLSFCPIF